MPWTASTDIAAQRAPPAAQTRSRTALTRHLRRARRTTAAVRSRLAMKPRALRAREGRLEIGRAPARRQHDERRRRLRREHLRQLDPGRVRQQHVEQHDVGPQRPHRRERRGAVARLVDDREAGRLEQPPRQAPEARVVVDDEHRCGHEPIVAHGTSETPPGFPGSSSEFREPRDDSGPPASYRRADTTRRRLRCSSSRPSSSHASSPSRPVRRRPRRHRSGAGAGETPSLQQLVDELVRDGAPGAIAVVRTPAGIRRVQSGLARRRPGAPMAADLPVPRREHHEELRRDDRAPARRGRKAAPRRHRRAPASRARPDGSAITIRELLDHTSGLFEYLDDAAFVRAVIAQPGRTWPPRRLVAIASSHGSLFPPGSNFHYCEHQLHRARPRRRGRDRNAVRPAARARLFASARARRDLLPAGTGCSARMPTATSASPRCPGSTRCTTQAWSRATPSPGRPAGLVSTADDVTRFYEALLGGRLLPPRLLAAMETPSARRVTYGLGLLVAETPCGRAYGHEGIATGYRSCRCSRTPRHAGRARHGQHRQHVRRPVRARGGGRNGVLLPVTGAHTDRGLCHPIHEGLRARSPIAPWTIRDARLRQEARTARTGRLLADSTHAATRRQRETCAGVLSVVVVPSVRRITPALTTAAIARK